MDNCLLRLKRVRGIANYQFEQKIGRKLFPKEVKILLSKRTGRIRHLYLEEALIATLRPTDGFFSLTIAGARKLSSLIKAPRFRVAVQNDVKEFAKKGRDVFARHVSTADVDIKPGEETIVTDDHDEVLAIGRAVLTGEEMLAFKRGVAVKSRRGVTESRNVA